MNDTFGLGKKFETSWFRLAWNVSPLEKKITIRQHLLIIAQHPPVVLRYADSKQIPLLELH